MANQTQTNWIAQKAMLVSLSISRFNPHAFDKRITAEVNDSHGAVSDAGRYNKRLVDKSADKPISQVCNEARNYHMRMTSPWLDNANSRILPAALYLKYTEQMNKYRKAFEEEVDKFVAHYPEHVERRKKAINGLFNEDDYPTQAELVDLHDFHVRVMPAPDAGDFRVALAAEHADDIRRSIERDMKEALATAMREPARRIIETVGHMAERLKTYQKGDRMYASMVENVQELAEFLPAFNLSDDPALTKLLARMKAELSADVEELKESDIARKKMAAAAEDILAKARQMMA